MTSVLTCLFSDFLCPTLIHDIGASCNRAISDVIARNILMPGSGIRKGGNMSRKVAKQSHADILWGRWVRAG
jgi:hypothetical protein